MLGRNSFKLIMIGKNSLRLTREEMFKLVDCVRDGIKLTVLGGSSFKLTVLLRKNLNMFVLGKNSLEMSV